MKRFVPILVAIATLLALMLTQGASFPWPQ